MKKDGGVEAATHLFGWQGLTAQVPATWNLRAFEGDQQKGVARLADEEALRLELLWENPGVAADVPRSIDAFLRRLEKENKKHGRKIETTKSAPAVATAQTGRGQVVNFGWKSSGGTGPMQAGNGLGAAWQCTTCHRMLVLNVLGRRPESSDSLLRTAYKIAASLRCHGEGGWQTWSVFGLRLEVPEAFQLAEAKLMTGRLQLAWLGPPPPRWPPWGRWTPRERLALQRYSAANVVLGRQSLPQWTEREVVQPDPRKLVAGEPATCPEHESIDLQGNPRQLRQVIGHWLLRQVVHQVLPDARLKVWQCRPDNKLYVLDSELLPDNEHVFEDVLTSLQCHTSAD